jgi:hypothetical protein
LKLPQEEIYSRLEKSGILYDYIIHSYDVLHTFSERYIMSDLIEYMKEKGVLSDICIDDIFKELNVAEQLNIFTKPIDKV